MGKKSRKHKVETKSHLCFSLSDKSICKLVDELWERLLGKRLALTLAFVIILMALLESSKRFSNVPPLHVLWEEYDSVIGLLKTILLRQGDVCTQPSCVAGSKRVAIAGASPVPLPPRQEGFAAFLQWMRSNGASLEKVE